MNRRQLKLNDNTASGGDCVLYIMSRDQRVHDNHALLIAQHSAIESKVPLIVAFNLYEKTGFRAKEHYEFMVTGLKELAKSLQMLDVTFMVTIGDPVKNIIKITEEYNAKELIFDFNPLRGPRNVQKIISKKLKIPCSVVDTHNIIPTWVLSDKEEYAAHTIRRKVHKNIQEWLVEPAKVVQHPKSMTVEPPKIDWEKIDETIQSIKASGIDLQMLSGEEAAHNTLSDFIENRLDTYADQRNVPTLSGQSNLSPYLHFGHISSLRVALNIVNVAPEVPLLFEAGKLASYDGEPTKMDSINALLEELIVRKELADNFCFYNPNYDSLRAAKEWAVSSLTMHTNDEREYIYDMQDWETARSHDVAWNAAQKQLLKTGKMHGYMRMYWAKKILEWSISPEEAIQTAIYLNDHYSIDGGDPNGYTGIQWSICGVHDRPWFERAVFGKIRYMNHAGLKRKFNLDEYVNKWK